MEVIAGVGVALDGVGDEFLESFHNEQEVFGIVFVVKLQGFLIRRLGVGVDVDEFGVVEYVSELRLELDQLDLLLGVGFVSELFADQAVDLGELVYLFEQFESKGDAFVDLEGRGDVSFEALDLTVDEVSQFVHFLLAGLVFELEPDVPE